MACKLCASSIYTVGSVPRIRLEIRDDSGTLVTPGGLTFKLMNPAGVTVTYTLVSPQLIEDATGVYYVDYKVDMAGWWMYRFEATGSGEGAVEDTFEVERSAF